MTEIDIPMLREIRKAASPGPWSSGLMVSGRGYSRHISPINGSKVVATTGSHYLRGHSSDMYIQDNRNQIDADSVYISTFNPELVGKLLDRIEELEKMCIRNHDWRPFGATEPTMRCKTCAKVGVVDD